MLERLSGEDVFFFAAGWIWGGHVVDHGLIDGSIQTVPNLLFFCAFLWLMLKLRGVYDRL